MAIASQANIDILIRVAADHERRISGAESGIAAIKKGGGVPPAPPAPTPPPPPPPAPTPPPPPPPAPAPADPVYVEPAKVTPVSAVRFLHQAAFGANPTRAAEVIAKGITGYVTEQLAMPVSQSLADFRTAAVPGTGFNYGNGLEIPKIAFWHKALAMSDVIRTRVTLALSEMIVCSGHLSDQFLEGTKIIGYLDALNRNALGSHRQLIADICRLPAFAYYLTFLQNDGRGGTAAQADENFAREVMQLFTIGKFELNVDGTHKQLADGSDAQTYTNFEVSALAKVFTGWSYGNLPDAVAGIGHDAATDPFWQTDAGIRARREQAYKYGYFYNGEGVPLRCYGEHHNLDEKRLLNGVVLPAFVGDANDWQATSAYGDAELEKVVDMLHNHPNVGPMLARFLIQYMVTSNPTPAYVSRVARKFNDNGAGKRGDMAAVVRQVLLDPEARDDAAALASNTFGKLREPMYGWLHNAVMSSSFNDGLAFGSHSYDQFESIAQNVACAPSVFNWYRPEYSVPGSGLITPEFQMLHESSGVGWNNNCGWPFNGNVPTVWNAENKWLSDLIPKRDEKGNSNIRGDGVVVTDAMKLADTKTLISRIGLFLTGNLLSATTAATILTGVQQRMLDIYWWPQGADWILQDIVGLIQASPDYRIQK